MKKKIYAFTLYERDVNYLDEIVAKQRFDGMSVSRSQVLGKIISEYRKYEESRNKDK